MNRRNPSRSSGKQRKQANLPFQNEENASEQMQAQMDRVIVEGIGKFYLGSMEEEIDEDPTEELHQEPEENNDQYNEEFNEFSQEDENNEDDEESFGVNVEILISAGGACFDSSSPGMEEEIASESDEIPHDFASTAESGVYISSEETPKMLFPFDPYSLGMRDFKDEEPAEEILEYPVDFEKELGEDKEWKQLAEKEKIEVGDFLAGYNWKGKTRGFLEYVFDLALSMDLRSAGMIMKQGGREDTYERVIFRASYYDFE